MTPFFPNDQGTLTLTVGVANASAEIPTFGAQQLEFNAKHTNSDVVYVRIRPAGAAATVAASYPILPGHCKLISIPQGTSIFIDHISGTAAQVLFVTPGNGAS